MGVEAEPTGEKTAHEALDVARRSVVEIATKILLMKKESQPKSELRELSTQMSLLFITLRQLNRTILVEEDRIKAETESAKAPVDFTTLQLHNLMYEKNHYLKAIKTCRDFRSKYPDIELVPEEEYFKNAPEDIKSKVLASDEAHDLMLKRLNYELFQVQDEYSNAAWCFPIELGRLRGSPDAWVRPWPEEGLHYKENQRNTRCQLYLKTPNTKRKELCKLHEKLEQHKRSPCRDYSKPKKFLSSLPSHLKSLKKATLPVQHQLGILHSKKLKQNSAAELLPPPLYILYSQLLHRRRLLQTCLAKVTDLAWPYSSFYHDTFDLEALTKLQIDVGDLGPPLMSSSVVICNFLPADLFYSFCRGLDKDFAKVIDQTRPYPFFNMIPPIPRLSRSL
ncbi:hypothetical protein KSP40_PGU020503 [Platanthera guangdongensis]|uniref:Uncharacterized protein n=1 Tax=Platanthera guangdongensis TaxID=2320717 RepID=A0ABR2N5H9_9ASPA